jgi:double-stranded uracil-DNA glycosylase
MILPDYLCAGLDVVFCGTAAGNKSAAKRHYYADPTNKFWRILHETGLTPRRLTPEMEGSVADHGIGLTDLVKLHAGTDRTLRREMYDIRGFEARIAACAPRHVAFNGKEAPAVYLGAPKRKLSYGRQQATIKGIPFFVLPNTSGSNGNAWDERFWHELASLVGTT